MKLRVAVVAVLVLLGLNACAGDVMRWRNVGVSGFWDDPTNWVSEEDGAARVPTKEDDVVLGDELDLRFLGVYTITRADRPVEVNSLSIHSIQQCEASLYGAYSVWNGTHYLPQSSDYLGKRYLSGVLLDVVAPTTLVVHRSGEGAMTIGENSILRMSGSVEDPWLPPCSDNSQLSFVNGGSLVLQHGSEWTGSGVILGNVKAGHRAKVRPLVWWKGQPYPDEGLLGGTLQVTGNLSLSGADLDIFVNGLKKKSFSQIRVEGELYMHPLPRENYLYISTGGNWSASSSSSTKSPSLVLYEDLRGANGIGFMLQQLFALENIPLEPISFVTLPCNVEPGVVDPTPSSCRERTSKHDLSFLLAAPGVSQECPAYSCPGRPPCSGRGTCESGYCICHEGWADLDCSVEDCPGFPDCSGHGYCLVNEEDRPVCQCLPGWEGKDCGEASCPNDCTGEAHGYCDSSSLTPQCVCKPGYVLGPEKDCALPFMICPGLEEECSGFGECNRENGTCSCHANRMGADCSIPSCPFSPLSTECSHHGVCTWDALLNSSRCQCDEGWSGEDCSSPSLDCTSPEACSGHGVCVSELDPPRCLCDGPKDFVPSFSADEEEARGWTGEECEVLVLDCASEESKCGSRCGNNLVEGFGCMMNECPLGWKGWDCTTPVCLNTGNPECHGHGRCVGPQDKSSPPQCQCRDGWLPPDCRFGLSLSLPLSPPLKPFVFAECDCADHLLESAPSASCSVVGEGEEECSGRGTCNTDLSPPRCVCHPFAYGPLCEQYDPPCAGHPEECSGHGTCRNGTCECGEDWRGLDCSIIDHKGECLNNCSSNGVCKPPSSGEENVVAVCHCFEGWAGSDCSREASGQLTEEQDFMDENPWAVPVIVLLIILIAVIIAAVLSAVLYRRRRQARAKTAKALSRNSVMA
ncbi:Tenascin N [Balamuthia mandrillaris]